MKKVTFLMAFLLLGCLNCSVQQPFTSVYPESYSSTSEFPFQVLHAESVQSSKTTSRILPNQMIGRGDTLSVVNNGHLILVHYSGKFLEFENNRTLSIDSLNQVLIEDHKLAKDISTRPNLSLFQDPFYKTGVGGGGEGGSPIEIIIGRQNNIVRGKTCLMWETQIDGPFIVSAVNIFDQPVLRVETNETSIVIDFNEIVDRTTPLAIVQVKSKLDETYSSWQVAYVFVNFSNYFIPNLCEVDSSIEALEAAFYLESIDEKGFSRVFLGQARSFSKRPFYTEYLKNWD